MSQSLGSIFGSALTSTTWDNTTIDSQTSGAWTFPNTTSIGTGFPQQPWYWQTFPHQPFSGTQTITSFDLPEPPEEHVERIKELRVAFEMTGNCLHEFVHDGGFYIQCHICKGSLSQNQMIALLLHRVRDLEELLWLKREQESAKV